MAKFNSKAVKEALLDYDNLAKTLKENTQDAVKSLLDETVKKEYQRILSEDDSEDDEYDEEEVEGTPDETEDANDDVADVDSDATDDEESSEASDEDADESDEDTLPEVSAEDDLEDEEDEDWDDFEDYKVSDDEYDFSNASDEEVIKVYKKLNDTDQILVHKDDNGNVEIKDNENGTEYLIDLGEDDSDDVTLEDDEDMEPVTENVERVYEVVMNEYDSHVGYTDNYQKKDAMTTPGMSEPGKNVNDWDAGVAKGKSKPWAGKQSSKTNKPFNEEEDVELDEAGMTVSRATYKTTNKNAAPNNPGHVQDGAHNISQAGEFKGMTAEAVMKKANKIFEDNKKLIQTLAKFKKTLQEAAVTNVNLGQIIKLISENTTTADEKKEIIKRFGQEAKTMEQSKNLYESISRDLKKASKMNITEDTNLSVTSSQKINETAIYRSSDLLDSLELMHKLCK